MVNIRGAGGAATDMWCRIALCSARMVSGANSLLAGSFGWSSSYDTGETRNHQNGPCLIDGLEP